MTPRQAVRFEDICKLHTDNMDAGAGWIHIGANVVILGMRGDGERLSDMLWFSRHQFNKLIDWYACDQPLEKNI